MSLGHAQLAQERLSWHFSELDGAGCAELQGVQSHPGTSTEQAHQIAVHMLSTEFGRHRVVKQGEQILMKVPVRFD
jgi:hypothetical protein